MKKIQKTYLVAKTDPIFFLRFVLVLSLLFIGFAYFSITVFATEKQNQDKIPQVLGTTSNAPLSIYSESIGSELKDFNINGIKKAEQKKIAEEKRLAEEKRIAQERQTGITRINNFLVMKRSPVANTSIAAMIYDISKQYGADYKITLAIMGIESGFCAQSFSYNCFGYLNGAKYSSYEHAFADLLPKVTSQYVIRFGTNFVGLAKAYGMVNWQAGSANLSMYYNQV